MPRACRRCRRRRLSGRESSSGSTPSAGRRARPSRSGRSGGGGRALWWAGWAGLAAAAALLVVVNTQLSRTREEIRALRGGCRRSRASSPSASGTLGFLSDPNVRYVSLAGLKPTPEASAWLLWNPTTRQGLLLARGLPAPPAGQAYELWALAGAQPVPAGVFSVDAAGRALLRLPALPADHTFDAFAVTLEPAGGVPEPTGPMHLHGKVL